MDRISSFTCSPAWCLLAFVLCHFASSRAQASGLFFSDRGVRSMGRAGAHVAGADDLSAVVYNPAGLAGQGSTLFGDLTLIRLRGEVVREIQVEDSGGTIRDVIGPPVNVRSPLFPIPAGALSYRISNDLTVAGMLHGPYVNIFEYDRGTINGQPSPGRYALGSLDESRMAFASLAAGYRVTKWLKLGLGGTVLVGTFRSSVAFSVAPPDRVIAAPEDPNYDAFSRLSVGPMFRPSGNAGFIATPVAWIRIGASYQTRTVIDSDAEIEVRLPVSAGFDLAHVNGNKAAIRMVFPAVLRTGIEFDVTERLRAEISYVREFWSEHDTIDVTPKQITITGIPGAPSHVVLPAFSIPRHFRDSNSYRLGLEQSLGGHVLQTSVRAGVSYEQSAVPPAYRSLNSFDLDKVLLTFGASLQLGPCRFDFLYAHGIMMDSKVKPADARLGRIMPISGNARTEPINGGSYSLRGQLIGLGMQYRWRND